MGQCSWKIPAALGAFTGDVALMGRKRRINLLRPGPGRTIASPRSPREHDARSRGLHPPRKTLVKTKPAWKRWSLLTSVLALLSVASPAPATDRHPNILFIILDDVGVDQLSVFNPQAPNPPATPNMDTVAAAGLKFTRFYTMPECSPTRTCFFTGRYPLRTGVNAAILSLDLPAAQCSPYEVTTPRVLATAGYQSSMIGKFHLSGPDNNPYGFGTPHALGWDYFNGTLYGAPAFIDPSLGGQYPEDRTNYCWGFPVGDLRGVGWFLTSSNGVQCDDNLGLGYTGKEIATLGGIPALDASGRFATNCADALASGRSVSFSNYNGYYMWPKAVNVGTNVITSIGRKYIVTDQTDEGIAWIRAQTNGTAPWMCTLSYSAIHTPYQPPPDHLYPPGFVWPPDLPANDSSDYGATKVVNDLMVSAMDREIGRLLVESGLASWGPAGQLIYDPAATDTLIVIAGDNGTYLYGVNYPFNPTRSKGTPYETGIRAPLIVAGPMVASPGRSVEHLVSCVDLYQLFGEVADVNVRTVVPPAHILDSQSMLPYLTNASQSAIRQTIYSEQGNGVKAPASHMWPTVVSLGPEHVATDTLFTTQALAEMEGGTWYGPGGTQVFFTACDLRAANLYSNLTIVPTRVWTVLNHRYKLIKLDRAPCDASLGQFEFYDLHPTPLNPLNPLGLDNSPNNLLNNGVPVGLTLEQQANYDALQAELSSLLASEPACYADGNLDKQVTQADVDGVLQYWGQPSWFDVNRDGMTDQKDLDCVLANLGLDCLVTGPGVICPTPVYLNEPRLLANGAFQFVFTGVAGTSYTVFGTTNLALPAGDWTALGPATNTGLGYFQFTDAPAPDRPRVFYQVRAP